MSAKSITIRDTKKAIADGIIAGSFNSDNTIFKFNDIKYSLSSGKQSIWRLFISLLDKRKNKVPITDEMLEGEKIENGYKAVIETESGQEGGKVRNSVPTFITEGKHIGAINETNIITQAFRDAFGLYSKKLKKVNSNMTSAIVAIEGKDDVLHGDGDVSHRDVSHRDVNMPPPMLVQNIKNNALTEADFRNGLTLQKKIDGVHYITFKDINGKIIKYSRSGLQYSPTSMPKLNEELEILFNVFNSSFKTILNNIPNLDLEMYKDFDSKNISSYFAGELYKHGLPLNIISGQARKEETTIDLEYHIFDTFFPIAIERGHNMESKYRQLILDDLFAKLEPFNLQYIKRVENFKVHSMEEINAYIEQFLKDGYEGGIVRKDNGIYQYSLNNYHSKNILKIKPTFDDEFPIIGFTQGSKGKDLGALIWICSLKDNKDITFHVVPNLPLIERKQLFKELSNKGIKNVLNNEGNAAGAKKSSVNDFPLLTVSYAGLSPKGIPLQPKGIAVRNYE